MRESDSGPHQRRDPTAHIGVSSAALCCGSDSAVTSLERFASLLPVAGFGNSLRVNAEREMQKSLAVFPLPVELCKT